MKMRLRATQYGKSLPIPTKFGEYEVTDKEVLNKDQDRFTMIANRIVHSQKLSPKEKNAYQVLKSFCFDTDVCWPSEALIAHLCQCDPKSVRKYIKKLCELKLVAKLTVNNKHGTQRRCFYLMLPSSEWLIEEEGQVYWSWNAGNDEYGEIDDDKEEIS